MKFLLRTLAVSLMFSCQLVASQNAANVSQAPAPQNARSTNPLPRGVDVLSKASGFDIMPYVEECYSATYAYWNLRMPKEAEYPQRGKGQVSIQFEIQRNGKIRRHSMAFVSRSGNSALDQAAWKSIKKSKYPPLPKEFKGQYVPLRFYF